MVLGHTSAHQTGRFPPASGYIILDDADMEDTSLEEISTTSSPTAKTAGPNHGSPPSDAAHLWEEANKALGELLSIKSSIDAHQHKLVWELSMDLCQNNSETAESVKEAKAVCTLSIKEAKTLCSTVITETEAQGASKAGSLQPLHTKTIQHLEEEAIKEESKGQLNFLSVCQAALQVSPPKLFGALVTSYHILLGHVLMSHPFSLPKKLPPLDKDLPPGFPPLLHLSIHLNSSGSITLQTQWMSCHPVGPHPM